MATLAHPAAGEFGKRSGAAGEALDGEEVFEFESTANQENWNLLRKNAKHRLHVFINPPFPCALHHEL